MNAGLFLKAIFMLLQDFDYRVCKLMPDHVQRVAAYDNRLENFQFQHFGMVHADIHETGIVRPLKLWYAAVGALI